MQRTGADVKKILCLFAVVAGMSPESHCGIPVGAGLVIPSRFRCQLQQLLKPLNKKNADYPSSVHSFNSTAGKPTVTGLTKTYPAPAASQVYRTEGPLNDR
jgi:hypothetical protein